jgi:hypothetical protein
MDSDLIKKIFNDYYGKGFDLYGLKFSLFDIHDKTDYGKGHHFNFNFENPNDVSYHYSIIEEHLIVIVGEFSKYLSIEDFKVSVVFRDDQPKFYLNNELKNKIQKVFDEINFIEFKVWIGSYSEPSAYRIYGTTTGIKPYWDSDAYMIDNKFKPTRATLDGEEIEIDYVLREYEWFLQDRETYWETENIYSKVDSIILESKYPFLVMDGYASYYNTKFVEI